ncbi:hypothetical protein [Mucilaginibacter frigoritolerans]|uniref:hypothetical protein n=1 Tax=Mucilaginibacter frigoritolerans TaxID=652788 RepID=UPI00119EDB5B|nr:hypothetical protein [Mucilaginibacter frigoritolerans]
MTKPVAVLKQMPAMKIAQILFFVWIEEIVIRYMVSQKINQVMKEKINSRRMITKCIKIMADNEPIKSFSKFGGSVQNRNTKNDIGAIEMLVNQTFKL